MSKITNERLAEMLAGLDGVTPGPWGVWEECTPTKADAIHEFEAQVEQTDPFAGYTYLLDANGKCPASTGCGPSSKVNASHIARCDPDTIRSILTELQSLRAQGGVRVKPLEWTRGWMNAEAQTEIGQYIITYRRDGSFEWGIGILKGWASSWDEAKSAAQADYERRILSFLEASPAPVSEDVVAQTIWNEHLFHADALVYGDKMIVPDMAMAERLASIIVAALAAKGGQ